MNNEGDLKQTKTSTNNRSNKKMHHFNNFRVFQRLSLNTAWASTVNAAFTENIYNLVS